MKLKARRQQPWLVQTYRIDRISSVSLMSYPLLPGIRHVLVLEVPWLFFVCVLFVWHILAGCFACFLVKCAFCVVFLCVSQTRLLATQNNHNIYILFSKTLFALLAIVSPFVSLQNLDLENPLENLSPFIV